jgi:nucleobase:cation symporter-1, NCS1 family
MHRSTDQLGSTPSKRLVEIETHSIDFVPLSERYGSPRRLFTIWFSCNLTILGVAAGTLGVMSGLSIPWAIAAIAIGNAIGSIFVAAHSAQGPQLGVPQMIQSRAQFGVLGAGIPLIAVIMTYLLYSAADGLIIERTLRSFLPVDNKGALIVFGVATLFVAFMGYELIHRLGKLFTFISGGFFSIAAILLLVRYHQGTLHLHTGVMDRAFSGSLFVLTLTQAAAWSLSYAPYVADYSRYLPIGVTASSTFWYTGLGCFLGSTLIMVFGVGVGSLVEMSGDLGIVLAKLFGPWRGVALVLIAAGVVQGNVLNLYSAYMSTVTILSGFRRMNTVSIWRKLLAMSMLTTIATLIAVTAQENFQIYFSDVLSIMIYLLVPWSAINLADYYLVCHGAYDVDDLFRTNGQYGAYRWPTIGVFLLGIMVQMPFMSLSYFQGTAAKWIGSDVAWLPGLLIPGALHVWVGRSQRASLAARIRLAGRY